MWALVLVLEAVVVHRVSEQYGRVPAFAVLDLAPDGWFAALASQPVEPVANCVADPVRRRPTN